MQIIADTDEDNAILAMADVRRINACVKACGGIPTAALEEGVVGYAFAACASASRQEHHHHCAWWKTRVATSCTCFVIHCAAAAAKARGESDDRKVR